MRNKWRPERWSNPYEQFWWVVLAGQLARIRAKGDMDRKVQAIAEAAYEEGAEAMVEALVGWISHWNPLRDSLGRVYYPIYVTALEALSQAGEKGISRDPDRRE